MWIAALLIGLAAFTPAAVVVFVLNRRDRRAASGEQGEPHEKSYGAMNRQGLGWGTRDNDRGGL
jgi:hypothetical protein